MKIQRWCALALLPLLMLVAYAGAEDKKKEDKGNVCMQANPVNLCTAANTCGADCSVDVKRTSYSSSATPNIAGVKGNEVFCVKSGTTVTWMSSAKNIGFLVSFGDSSPFDSANPIMGGTDKAVPMVASKAGCYKYDVSATAANGVYGKSKAAQAFMIVVAK